LSQFSADSSATHVFANSFTSFTNFTCSSNGHFWRYWEKATSILKQKTWKHVAQYDFKIKQVAMLGMKACMCVYILCISNNYQESLFITGILWGLARHMCFPEQKEFVFLPCLNVYVWMILDAHMQSKQASCTLNGSTCQGQVLHMPPELFKTQVKHTRLI
jgi:hypothetical protein